MFEQDNQRLLDVAPDGYLQYGAASAVEAWPKNDRDLLKQDHSKVLDAEEAQDSQAAFWRIVTAKSNDGTECSRTGIAIEASY